MSDFLGNLIARSLSHAECVRPQIRSPFELPPPESNFSPILGEFDSWTEAPADQKRHFPTPVSPSAQTAEEPWTRQRVTNANPAQDRLSAIDPKPSTHNNLQPAETAYVWPRATTQLTPPRSPSEPFEVYELDVQRSLSFDDRRAPTPNSNQNVRVAPEPSSELIAQSTSPLSTSPHTPSMPLSARKDDDRTDMQRHSRDDAQSPISQVASARPHPEISVFSQRSVTSDFPRDITRNISKPVPPEAKSSPTIHVTIGRVEIRAVVPPTTARPQPQTAKSPTLDLEEYLRGRTTGGRR